MPEGNGADKPPSRSSIQSMARGGADMRQAATTGDAPGLSAVSGMPPPGFISKDKSRPAAVTDAGWSQLQRTNTTNIDNLPGDPLAAWRSRGAPHIDSGRRVLDIRQFDDADDAAVFVSAFGPRVDQP